MKLIITLMVIGLIAIGVNFFVVPDTTSYEKPVAATSTVETVEVDRIEARIEAAQEAAMADIEQEANTMRDAFIENELKTIEAAVLEEIEAELKARRIEREKETGAY